MSLTVKAALLATRDLRGTDRLVILAIAAHTNRNGDAWPAVATIADYVGCSERTVQRSLARLVQAGRLAVRRIAGIATRVYRIITGGVTSADAGVTDRPSRGDTQDVSPEEEEGSKGKPRVRAHDWRQWIPKTRRPAYPDRRGPALPPPRTDQCPRHPGWLAHNCGGCRSETLAGGVK